MLEVSNISKSFKGVQALKNVSITFLDGEIHGVVGENGAGKSTLMKIISGIYPPDSGTIKINGVTVSFANPIEAYNAGIRIVHQELSLIRSLTIAENIFIHKFRNGKAFKFIDRKKLELDAKNTLAEWGIDLDPSTMVGQVPMGLRQIVEIARELSTSGKIIILDEPTSSLTDKEIERLFKVIKLLRNKGYIIIFISHRLNEVIELADRITVLRDGEVITTDKTSNFSSDQICKLIAGKEINELFPKTNTNIGDIALEIKNLSGKGFNNISFTVRWGEILGIAGLMGAGRSELIRAIFGINEVYSGQIYLKGQQIKIKCPAEAIRRGIVLLSENRSEEGIFPDLSVAKNLVIIKLKEVFTNYLLNLAKLNKKTNYLVEKLGIVTHNPYTQVVSQLSGGNQQKVLFGRLLGSSPRILLLDEPTRGVDVVSKTEIHKIMGEFVKEGGAIVMVSSEINELIGICDRVVVLHEGEYMGTFAREQFEKEALLRCMMGVLKIA